MGLNGLSDADRAVGIGVLMGAVFRAKYVEVDGKIQDSRGVLKKQSLEDRGSWQGEVNGPG